MTIEIKPKKRITRKRDKYLNNKNMFNEILICQQTGEISDKLGNMFLLLARRYAKKPNFSGYTYIDEMISNGILSCVAAVYKFDPEKSNNPFAYFTSVIHRAFLQTLGKERKQQEVRDKAMVASELNPSYSFTERHKDEGYLFEE